MNGFRKTLAMLIALSLLLISSIPMASAMTCDMSGLEMQVEVSAPLVHGQDCWIECACHVDNQLDGMPHQMAPQILSQVELMIAYNEHDACMTSAPALIPLYLFPSPPPPKIR